MNRMNSIIMQGFAERLIKEAGKLRRGIIGGLGTAIGAGVLYSMVRGLPVHNKERDDYFTQQTARLKSFREVAVGSSSIEDGVKTLIQGFSGIPKTFIRLSDKLDQLVGDLTFQTPDYFKAQLMMEIKETYDVDIPDSELSRDNLTIRDIVDYIKNHTRK